MDSDYQIRKMTRDEVQTIAIEWALSEGWNPGLYDADCFYEADPQGFFVGLLQGEPVACISAVAYDDQFGFIGLYIVKEGYRKQGYGIKIWNAAMDYLGSRNIGLDGVKEQQENYRKSGFQLAYCNVRYEGVVSRKTNWGENITSINLANMEQVIAYDEQLFPAKRRAFLQAWLTQPNCIAIAATNDGSIKGYALMRKCARGYKFGPLFADDIDTCTTLTESILSKIPQGSIFYLDLPEVNPLGMQIISQYDLQPVFGTARMYTLHTPSIDIHKVYGVTTFELG